MPKELRAIVLSGSDRGLLFDVMRQMHSESRRVFAGAVRSVVEAYDAARPMVPFEEDDTIEEAVLKALMMAGAEEGTAKQMIQSLKLDVKDGVEYSKKPAGEWLRRRELLRSALEWAALDGYKIRDPDGWRTDGKSLDALINQAEYQRRLNVSTIGPA